MERSGQVAVNRGVKMSWSNVPARLDSGLVRLMLTVVLVLAGIAAGYGFSIVQAQDESSEIMACVNRWTGDVRIPRYPGRCSSTEYTLSWSQGAQGMPGPQGPSGISEYETITQESLPMGADLTLSQEITCPADKTPISGGYTFDPDSNLAARVTMSMPVDVDDGDPLPDAWRVIITNPDVVIGSSSDSDVTGDLWVTCANVASEIS